LVEQSGELIPQAVIRGGRGVGFAGGFAELGGQGEGLAGVGKTQLVQVVLIHALEIAFGDVEDGFGEGELAGAKGAGPGGGIVEIGLMEVALGAGGVFDDAGGVGFDAAAPVKVAGPAFDGARGDADFAGDSGKAAAGTKLEIGAKGLKSAVGFAVHGSEPGCGGSGFSSFSSHSHAPTFLL